jgi:formylglycine-generating enzyme required for sulfatase activity
MRKIKWVWLSVAFFSVIVAKAQDYVPELVFVKGGTFTMGANNTSPEESPAHQITISDFYIGKFEVKVEQYKQFCQETKRFFPKVPQNPDWYEEHDQIKKWVWRKGHPIVNVNWFDGQAYCEWLSKKTGKSFRLPTEAEWEYVAKGGSLAKNTKFAGSNVIGEVAWVDETSQEKGTMPCGTKKPNEIGVYDMSGNAWEWCSDFYDGNYYKKSPKVNPQGPSHGQFRVIRGGSWYYTTDMATVTGRDGPYPEYSNWNYGFRVVQEP